MIEEIRNKIGGNRLVNGKKGITNKKLKRIADIIDE